MVVIKTTGAEPASMLVLSREDHDALHRADPDAKREITLRLIEIFDKVLFPDYENDEMAEYFYSLGVTFSDIAARAERTLVDAPAIFRLGQMDIKETIADMLRDSALQRSSTAIRAAILEASQMVREMEIPDGGATIENT